MQKYTGTSGHFVALLLVVCFVVGGALSVMIAPSVAQAQIGNCSNCGNGGQGYCGPSTVQCDCTQHTYGCTGGCSEGWCPV